MCYLYPLVSIIWPSFVSFSFPSIHESLFHSETHFQWNGNAASPIISFNWAFWGGNCGLVSGVSRIIARINKKRTEIVIYSIALNRWAFFNSIAFNWISVWKLVCPMCADLFDNLLWIWTCNCVAAQYGTSENIFPIISWPAFIFISLFTYTIIGWMNKFECVMVAACMEI